MNVQKLILFAAFVASLTAGYASAAPVGTAKARGDYRPFWETQGWSQGRTTGGARQYAYRAPAVVPAATATTESAPIVAEAPAEGRRFSYAPSAGVTTATPCPQANSTSPASEGDRRYSYAPAPESPTVAPAPANGRVYYSQPRYSGRRTSRSTVDRAALPKTDPRKYTTR